MVKAVLDPNEVYKTERFTLKDGLDLTTRAVMMVRNASFTYRNTYNMNLPGFMPNASMLGQNSGNGMLAPGLDFAFGLTDNSYLHKAQHNNWLLNNDSVSYAAATSAGESLQIKMMLEPFMNFRIDVNSSWEKSNSRTIQYMYAGMPESQTGTFSMTVVTLKSAFERKNPDNGYKSKSFERLADNINTVQKRVENQYVGAIYPEGTTLAGSVYNPENGGVNPYSADVLIPAFLAAYTGKDASKSSLNLFPNILSMMPNWSITYSGLNQIPFFQKYFKSFNLKHSYKSVYSMGSYNTFMSYMEYMNNLGFINDITTGNPIPNSMFNIGSVSINESFAPLVGVDMTFNNSLTARLECRKTRVINLSTSAVQVVETISDDITAGASYRISNLKLFGAQQGTGRNKVNNNLNMNLDFSYRNQNALCRNIKTMATQATSGNRAIKLAFSADYIYSKMLTLNFYYDFQSNFPLVSTSSYPTATHDCGITLKFSLTR